MRSRIPLDHKMDAIAGSADLLGWGSDSTPWFGGNPTDKPVSVQGITIPARSLAMHPGPDRDVAVGWRSPIQGQVKVKASVAHAQAGGNGIEWWVVRETKTDRKNLASRFDRRNRLADDSRRGRRGEIERSGRRTRRHDFPGHRPQRQPPRATRPSSNWSSPKWAGEGGSGT